MVVSFAIVDTDDAKLLPKRFFYGWQTDKQLKSPKREKQQSFLVVLSEEAFTPIFIESL